MPRHLRRRVFFTATAVLASTLWALPASAATTVTVNGATTFQKIDGFGISEAFGMANAIRGLGGTAQRQALDLRGATLTPAKRYYALANYSRFIRPGATRISASGSGSLAVSAFRNPDGSVIVVALNSGTSSVSAAVTTPGTGLTSGAVTPYLTDNGHSIAAQPSIALNGGAFSATVPARSLVTFRITR